MKLLVHHHLGLGDHFICNGLVRHLARERGEIGLFAYRKNAVSVAFMYRDDPRIAVIPVDGDAQAQSISRQAGISALRIGFEHMGCSGRSFAEDFYSQLGLDYRVRFDGFHVRRDPARERALFERLVGARARYAFLHEDRRRGFIVDRANASSDLPFVVPEPGLTDNIFDYVGVLEQAEELHLIDSSFLNLADSIQVNARRFAYHRYARPESPDLPSRHPRETIYRQRWIVKLSSATRRKFLGARTRVSAPRLGR